MKSTHKKIFRHICENLDERLDSPSCRRIREHLEGCSDCMAYLRSLMQTVALYRGYPEPPLSSKAKNKLRLLGR